MTSQAASELNSPVSTAQNTAWERHSADYDSQLAPCHLFPCTIYNFSVQYWRRLWPHATRSVWGLRPYSFYTSHPLTLGHISVEFTCFIYSPEGVSSTHVQYCVQTHGTHDEQSYSYLGREGVEGEKGRKKCYNCLIIKKSMQRRNTHAFIYWKYVSMRLVYAVHSPLS